MTDSSSKPYMTVVTSEYTPLGQEKNIAGLRAYVTGPTDAKVTVIVAYDVMGLSNNTKQGADIVSKALDALVIIPDLLKGVYADPAWLPPDTEDKREAFFGFLKGYAAPPKYVDAFLEAVKGYKALYPSVTRWGSYGLCWGGKVVSLASKDGTPFNASIQLHPGMLDPADARAITIPHMVLASKDEPADLVAAFKSVIEANGIGGFVETYATMFHGWMGTNANFQREASRNGYIRGYTQVLDFLMQYLL